TVINEGDFQVPVDPYAISYRCLTPKAEQCGNLLVPVAVSTTHVAYGTVRMEPVFMILGQAAGVAASMAIDGKSSVQTVPAAALTAKLLKQKAVLSPAGLPARGRAAGRIDPAKLAGIVVDDADAKLTGEWKRSSATPPFVGDGYLHDGDEEKGKIRARFAPALKPGRYEVWLHYPATTNRSRKTLVVVSSADGEKQARVDQRRKADGGLSLGTFAFDGAKGFVEVRNDGSDGHVIADAVRFVPAK
ncbi:MAG: FAD-dependent oxidoreductase, partial [Gemmataceae bacterium]